MDRFFKGAHRKLIKTLLVTAVIMSVASWAVLIPEHTRAANPTLTLTTQTPIVSGTIVTVAGSAFDATATVSFAIDGVPVTTNPATVTSSGAGAIPSNVSFTIPSLAIGSHTVQASSSATAVVQAVFVIATPTMTVTPANASATPAVVGSTMLAAITNMEALKTVTVYFDDATVATGTTSVTGSADVTFVVPDVNNTGTHTVRATAGSYSVVTANMFISTPSITLNPSTAVPGQPITITGTNFKADTEVTFTFNGNALPTSATVMASGGGGFASIVTVPDLIQGAVTVKAQSFTSLYATATLTIATPTLTVTPSTVAPGQFINVTGTNFKANAPVTFFMNGNPTPMNDSTVTANAQGFFVTTFQMPVAFNVAQSLKAQSFAGYFATAAITISTAAITITPTSGPDGGFMVNINGTGFDANSTVQFYVNNVLVSQTAQTGTVGAFLTTLALPSGIPSGLQTIKAQSSVKTFATGTYTVTAAASTVSPTAGTPGTRVYISGTNYDPSTIISFKWNGKELKMIEGTVSTNNAGSFAANFVVPETFVAGAGQIEVSTSQANTSIIAFTVAAPVLTLSATSGGPGTRINVTGTGFQGSQKLRLVWDADVAMTTLPSSVVTTPLGGFYAVVEIPKDVRGTHFITAYAGDTVLATSTSFTVSTPALTLSLASAQPSTKITVTGSALTPNSDVTLLWDSNTPMQTLDPAKTDQSGAFVAVFVVPANSTTGTHTLTAKTSNDVYGTAQFTVTTGSLTLSRSNGSAHSTVVVSGVSFDSDTAVSFYWDEQPITVATTLTDGIGGFNTAFVVPLSKGGVHIIRVSTSKFGTNAIDFTVDTPTITVTPSGGKPGDKIVAKGTGFVANERVGLTVNANKITIAPSDLASDAAGNFVASFDIPRISSSNLHIAASTSDIDMTVVDYAVQTSTATRVGRIGGYLTLIEIFGVASFLIIRKVIALGRPRHIIQTV